MFKIFLLSFLFINSVSASVLEVNEDHSKILFDIDYMSLTKVEGRFKDFSGTFILSNRESMLSDIKIDIKSSSIDTADKKRDFHLKGHEFFLAASYPAIHFESVGSVSIPGKNKKFNLPGKLTLRGIEKNMSLQVIYKGSVVDPWGKENYFFEADAVINRQDYNMNWNKDLDNGGFLVGNEVRIKLSVQAQVLGEKTAFSTHMIPATKGIKERHQLNKGLIKKLSTSTNPLDRK